MAHGLGNTMGWGGPWSRGRSGLIWFTVRRVRLGLGAGQGDQLVHGLGKRNMGQEG